MSKVYLRIENNGTPLYWGGNGWWTRRKDQALVFDTIEAAHLELNTSVSIEVESDEEAEPDARRAR